VKRQSDRRIFKHYSKYKESENNKKNEPSSDSNSVSTRCDVLTAVLPKILLGCDAVLLVEYFPTFRKIVVPSSSVSNSPSRIVYGLLDKYLRNVGTAGPTTQRHIPGDLNSYSGKFPVRHAEPDPI
jgi:hypothetical protein